MARTILLTKGQVAIVDDEDYEGLVQFNWQANSYGYAIRIVRNGARRCPLLMHRLVIQAPLGSEVDHINGNRLDNRKRNLRLVTRSQNNMNRKPNANSNCKGVCWRDHANAWKAYIKINRKQLHLGYFKSKRQAAEAYNRAAVQLFGSYARLNDLEALS